MRRFKQYAVPVIVLGSFVGVLGAAVLVHMDSLGMIDVFKTLGRRGVIAVILGLCFLAAVFSVFWGDENRPDLDIPNSIWGWIKAIAIILFLTAVWFAGCVAPGQEYPYF